MTREQAQDICAQRDREAEYVRIRAILKRRRQLLCRCDADILIGLRKLRLSEAT